MVGIYKPGNQVRGLVRLPIRFSKLENGAVIDTGQRACCEQRVLRGMELSLIQVGGPVQQIIEHVNK